MTGRKGPYLLDIWSSKFTRVLRWDGAVRRKETLKDERESDMHMEGFVKLKSQEAK